MKLPKTFLPNKNLEIKIKKLLEKQVIQKNETEKNEVIEKVKNKFPNFINYILDLYPDLKIIEIRIAGSPGWSFVTFNGYQQQIGLVYAYTTNLDRGKSEYGYKGQVLINGSWHVLEYRKGYCYLDNIGMITTEDPCRLDLSKEIPFP